MFYYQSKRVSDSDKGTDTELEDEYRDVSVSDISSEDVEQSIAEKQNLKALEIGGQLSPLLGKRRSSATVGAHARTMKKVKHKVP